MSRRLAGAVLWMAALSAPAMAQTTNIFGPEAPSSSQRAKPVQLAKIVINLKRGDPIGRAKYGLLCLWPENLAWKADPTDIGLDRFDAIFREEMTKAGFAVVGDPAKMFENAAENPAQYLLGGAINRMDMQVCYRGVNRDGEDYEGSSGKGSLEVEWQIYSPIERKVTAVIKTTGTSDRPKAETGGAFGVIYDAFRGTVRQLASDPAFIKSFSGPVVDVSVARLPSRDLVPIAIKSARRAPIALNETVASTVLIFANGGQGSGFLVGPEGYLITNHHVIAGSQFVKVRWSDGTEGLGEVVRSDKARDVALLKTDPKGHRPLAPRGGGVTIGEDIYAIGAPTGEQFQFSMTKGIVSATRVMDGFNYIQSDVGVTHGNSGGPIVDGKGQVVGLTVSGREDLPMLNFFIPIGEALGLLGVQMVQVQ